VKDPKLMTESERHNARTLEIDCWNPLLRVKHLIDSTSKTLMASRIHERIAALDSPDNKTDEEEIWALIRFSLVVLRVLLFVAIIIVSEVMESVFLYNLSMALWALIIGIPLFVLLSMGILFGDRMMKHEETGFAETTILRPIRERL